MHINLLYKKLNLVLNYKELYHLQKHFDSKILQDKLLCVYHC